MTNNRQVAGRILDMSKQAVTTVRGGQHGPAKESFDAIGTMWFAYLNALSLRNTGIPLPTFPIMAKDVAFMMGHVKEMRVLFGDEQQPDNYVDYAGYGALAGMFHVPEAALPPAYTPPAAAREQQPDPIPRFLNSSMQIEIPHEDGQRVIRIDRDIVEHMPVANPGEMIPDDWVALELGPNARWPDEGRAVKKITRDENGVINFLILGPAAKKSKAK